MVAGLLFSRCALRTATDQFCFEISSLTLYMYFSSELITSILCPKHVPTFPPKNWVPEWCSVEYRTHPPHNSPCDQFPKLGVGIEIVSSINAGPLCSPPSSHSGCSIPPVPDFGCPPHFSCNQPVPATYMYSVHHMYFPSLPPAPPRPSICEPHNLLAPHLKLHPSSLMSEGALGCILYRGTSLTRKRTPPRTLP